MYDHAEPPHAEIPPEAYQLADHLDAALAAAEDLVACGHAWQSAQSEAGRDASDAIDAEHAVIERIKTFEAVLTGRVLKARKRADVLSRKAAAFAGITRLFIGGTAILADAVEELGDSTRSDFETGCDAVAYLRRRGLLADDAADLPETRTISIDDSFLVAGRIPLGPLVEMIVAFLDALEAHYDLYPEDGSDCEPEEMGLDELIAAMRREAPAVLPAAATMASAAEPETPPGATKAIEDAQSRSMIERLDAVARHFD